MEPLSPVSPRDRPVAEELHFIHQGIPVGFLPKPDEKVIFTLAKATPTIPYIFIDLTKMEKRLRIRREYPGVYPSLQLDAELAAAVYKFFYDLWKQTNDPWYAEFLYLPVLGAVGLLYYHIVYILDDDVIPNPWTPNPAEQVKKAFTLPRYPGPRVLRGLTVDRKNALLSVKTYIEEFYRSNGFAWHYFIAVNEKDPRVQANLGLLELTPKNFELGSFSLDRAQEALNHLRTRGTIRTDDQHTAPYVGWTYDHLISAIKKSGLAEPDGRILRSKVGVGHTNYAAWWQIHVAGLTHSGPKWLPKLYYETLYRKFFDTLSYLDWSTACATPHVGVSYLRTIANEAFGLPASDLKKMNKEAVCAALTKAAAARREFAQSLKEHLPFQSQAVLLQPGSRWVGTRIAQTQAQMGDVQITHPYERMVYIRALCEDPKVDTEMLIRKLGTVGMGDLVSRVNTVGRTKAELCEFFLERLTADAEKFEFIFVDCRNPAISKRHILQTLAVMELSGIFKNVDTEKATKAEICAIVESYIQVLMEDRALTLAQ